MINENGPDVVLLAWSPRRPKTRVIAPEKVKDMIQGDGMALLKLKAENDRLSARIAILEAQLAKADSVLSRAVLEAFGAYRKAVPNRTRHRLSA